MTKETSIKLFEDKKVRTIWDEKKEEWYFSVVDIIAVLTESDNPQVYWRVLKKRLIQEGNETVTNCNGLKLQAPDGKMRFTDVADTEQVLRLVQSVPSKKAEPFKLWLAKVGSERINETIDPELSIDRAIQNYRRLPVNFDESAQIATEGATVAKVARKQIEKSTGKPAISSLNAKSVKPLRN